MNEKICYDLLTIDIISSSGVDLIITPNQLHMPPAQSFLFPIFFLLSFIFINSFLSCLAV